MPDRILERKCPSLRRLNPTEYRPAVRRHGPIRLQSDQQCARLYFGPGRRHFPPETSALKKSRTYWRHMHRIRAPYSLMAEGLAAIMEMIRRQVA